jgi:hypothetical protein
MGNVQLDLSINGLTVWLFFAVLVFTLMPGSTRAALGEDLEKPKPEFTHSGDKITAKLLPRAKSTSVLIDFKVSGGRLVDVQGMDFEKADSPEVDYKDFKSALFVVQIEDLSPGDTSKISITSDFFIRSTKFWIYNQKEDTPWMDAKAINVDRGDRIQELVIEVKDGSEFDSDGAKNGKIQMVGGPQDSFWGYALGTLFIRYFGIFLVLCILMVGMLFSGRIFQYLERKKAEKVSQPGPDAKDKLKSETAQDKVGTEVAAAITTALHIHLAGLRAKPMVAYPSKQPGSWAQQGRQQMMGERDFSINRNKH